MHKIHRGQSNYEYVDFKLFFFDFVAIKSFFFHTIGHVHTESLIIGFYVSISTIKYAINILIRVQISARNLVPTSQKKLKT